MRYKLVQRSVRDFLWSLFDPYRLDDSTYNEERVDGCGKGAIGLYSGSVDTRRTMCGSLSHCKVCAEYRIGVHDPQAGEIKGNGRTWMQQQGRLFGSRRGVIYWQVIRADNEREVRQYLDRASARFKKDGSEFLRVATLDGLVHFFSEVDFHNASNEEPSWPLHRVDAKRLLWDEFLVPLYVRRKPSAPKGSTWALDPEPESEGCYVRVGFTPKQERRAELEARCNALLDEQLPEGFDRSSPVAVSLAREIWREQDALLKAEEEAKARAHRALKRKGSPDVGR